MYRNREARRASIVGSNDFKRRRHRTNSLRESPEEDVEVELQESGSLRDRLKKDRDRERERERDRERDREREGERDLRERSNRSKRRRAERFTSNREDVGKEETSDESVDDNEDYEDEESTVSISASGVGVGGVRVLPPAVGSIHGNIISHHLNHNGSLSQSQHNFSSNSIISSNQLQHRKTFPPTTSSSKLFRPVSVRKPGDEMIGVSVPRKARTACTKRSHDWMSSSSNNNNCSISGVIGEQIPLQASSSPASQSPVSTTASLLAAPVSPSSNASIRKKLKLSNGPRVKPPKVSSNTSSSNPEELEIEIAEVLYGLKTQSQEPSLKKEDSREVTRSSSDTKSLISSIISNPASANNPVLAPNSSRLTVVAPKRKRPRQVVENLSYGVRSSPILEKPEMENIPKSEVSSPKAEKICGSATENGYEMGGDSAKLQGRQVHFLDLKARGTEFASIIEELTEGVDLVKEEENGSNKGKESSLVKTEVSSRLESTTTSLAAVSMIKESSVVLELENRIEKKFVIDLMMDLPPQVKSSPEREANVDLRASAANENRSLSVADAELKTPALMDGEYETEKSGKTHLANVANEEEKVREKSEEDESMRTFANKVRNNVLHLDLDESSRDGSAGVDAVDSKLLHRARKQLQQMPIKMTKEEPFAGKSGQPTNSLPVSVANSPGGLPTGYMTSSQGVVPMGGGTVTPAPIQAQFNQPRPKRCETHCYIARNISYIQQFVKMNPFWTAAGTASFLGSKPNNLSAIPVTDMHGGSAFKGVSNTQGQNLATITNHGGSEKSSQSASTSDSVKRKQQILLQQALPPVAPNNLLGPAFIFPLNQQQAAVAAASTRSSAPKSHNAAGQASSSTSSSSAVSGSNTAGAAATAVSFNYPNMGSNETQYLAILPNNAYPFPIPTVGAPPNYRGNPAQAMPLFTGPFYSSQMIHPSQLQHQHPPFPQPVQSQQAHKSSSSSSGSSSSQKHLQNQQLRSQSSGVNVAAGSTTLQNIHAEKSLSSHQLQQPVNQHVHSIRPRQLENESGEGSPSTADVRGSCPPVNMYGQNFSMPIHPQNFSLMAPPAGTSNHGERLHQQSQHPGSKAGMSSLPPHSFAMSFGPMNGAPSGSAIDISTAQNYAIFQSFPDSARQSIQMMAAATATAATAQVTQKNLRIAEDVKSGGDDPSVNDDERKSLPGKAQGGVGQSIQANNVIDGLPHSMSAASGLVRSSPPVTTTINMGAINVPNVHIQAQIHHQQIMQLKQQQQQLAATTSNQSKAPASNNGNIYSEHLNSSPSLAAKFPNSLSSFPQNMVQSNNISASKSPQWNNSSRTTTPQAPSHVATSTISTFKSLPQQHSRTQQRMHGQISFGGNQKPSPTSSPGQVSPNGNLAPSPVVVGSPTTSSISKGSSGSPRTAPASTNNKITQTSSLSTHQPKQSPSIPSQKPQSILGNHHVSSSSSGPKTHMQKQSHHQLPKNVQQTQLFFSNPYSQVQSPQSVTSMSSSASGPGGYYMQRRRPELHHQPTLQQLSGAAASTSSSGVLQLCPPVTLLNPSTNDPAKAVATGTCNTKGSGPSSQGIVHSTPLAAESAGTLLPTGFSYVQPVPAVVQAKPPEQKQTAG